MSVVLRLIVRAAILAAGLLFAAVFACVFVLLLSLWLVAAAWGKLTGRPAARFEMRWGPRTVFDEMARRAPGVREPSRTPRADAAAGVPRRLPDEVTDVEARDPRS